jgi:hypothetical protein
MPEPAFEGREEKWWTEKYAEQLARAREVVRQLSERHNEYTYGMGPCICEEHIAARKFLSSALVISLLERRLH